MILYILMFICLLGFEMYIQFIVEKNMVLNQSISIINGIFNITYIQNDGAMLNILSGRKFLLSFMITVIIFGLLWFLLSKRPKSKTLNIAIILIITGGIGNLIDRISFGYVVDYLDFCLINYPIFNIADVYVVCGVILMCIYALFIKKGELRL